MVSLVFMVLASLIAVVVLIPWWTGLVTGNHNLVLGGGLGDLPGHGYCGCILGRLGQQSLIAEHTPGGEKIQ